MSSLAPPPTRSLRPPPPASLVSPTRRVFPQPPPREAAPPSVAVPPARRLLRLRWQRWRSSRTLERLNHVLIPGKKADRDRYRNGLIGRLLGVVFIGIEGYTREGRALLLLTVLVGCSGLDVRSSQAHQLFAMLVALLLASLLSRPLFRTPGLRVVVTAPTRVMAGAPARFDLRCCNDGPRPHLNLQVELPFLPWDGRWQAAAAGIPALARGSRASVTATATFVARGEHHLDSFVVGALVPLGLAVGQRRNADVPRFLVVPRVANVVAVRAEHRLPERRGAVIASLRAGESELAGVRPYRAGDPLKHLHARTWARTGIPHVRSYVDERQDRVALLVVVDGDEATERTKEATLSLAAGVTARLALHDGGLDGLVIDEDLFEIEPRAGERALDRVLDRLGVHELTRRSRDTVAAITPLLPQLSSLVLVTAGAAPRHRTIVELAHRRGVPCRWAAVREPTAAEVEAGDATLIEVGTIEDGGAIAL